MLSLSSPVGLALKIPRSLSCPYIATVVGQATTIISCLNCCTPLDPSLTPAFLPHSVLDYLHTHNHIVPLSQHFPRLLRIKPQILKGPKWSGSLPCLAASLWLSWSQSIPITLSALLLDANSGLEYTLPDIHGSLPSFFQPSGQVHPNRVALPDRNSAHPYLHSLCLLALITTPVFLPICLFFVYSH